MSDVGACPRCGREVEETLIGVLKGTHDHNVRSCRSCGWTSRDEEVEYETGRRRALLGMLSHVLRELGISDPEAGAAVWIVERFETIQKLREVCGEYGDNDWPDNLHLRDVIEKHLATHLSDEAAERDRLEAEERMNDG